MRIVIFDEIEVIRVGLEQIITQNSDNKIVASFCDSVILTKFLKENDVDIIITGVYSEQKYYIDFLTQLHKNFSKIKFLLFTSIYDEFFIFNCLKIGVLGFVESTASSEEIIEAINSVSQNQEYFSSNISNIILKSYIAHVKFGEEISEKKPRDLTRREIQIIKLVSQGMTNQQIADGLFISIRTVNAHKSHIMQKLEIKTTADLIKFAIINEYVKF